MFNAHIGDSGVSWIASSVMRVALRRIATAVAAIGDGSRTATAPRNGRCLMLIRIHRFWGHGASAVALAVTITVAQGFCTWWYMANPLVGPFYFGPPWITMAVVFPGDILLSIYLERRARSQSDAACRCRYRLARAIVQVSAAAIVLIQVLLPAPA